MATTTTGAAHAVTMSAGVAVVNGPEDEVSGWSSIDWRQAEDDVRRLRQRIFTAAGEGDLRRVRNLQKLMLVSRSNDVISVRRVAEVNAGRKTAGIDGRTALLASQKAELAWWVQRRPAGWSPKPVRRVYIPKSRRETAPARDPSDTGPGVASRGPERAGTGVGGTVRTEVIWLQAGPWLS